MILVDIITIIYDCSGYCNDDDMMIYYNDDI